MQQRLLLTHARMRSYVQLLVPHFMPLAQLYAGALCAEDLEVRVIALQVRAPAPALPLLLLLPLTAPHQAACTLLVALKDAKQAMQLQQLVAPVLQVCGAIVGRCARGRLADPCRCPSVRCWRLRLTLAARMPRGTHWRP